jgi:hypothetical protein
MSRYCFVYQLWVESQYIDHLLEFKVPTCYFGKFQRCCDGPSDPDIIEHILDAESILVIQDMRAFEFGKRHFGEGMSIAEAMAAVTQITKFHAVSYAMQEKSEQSLEWKMLFRWKDLVDVYEVRVKAFIIYTPFL